MRTILSLYFSKIIFSMIIFIFKSIVHQKERNSLPILPAFSSLRRSCTQSIVFTVVTKNCEISVITLHNCDAVFIAENFELNVCVYCGTVTESCGHCDKVTLSRNRNFVITRRCVTIFRNYGSQCDHSYAVTVPQYDRNGTYGESGGELLPLVCQ